MDIKIVVLIPTYNNDKTLLKVVEGVKIYASDVLVVNDGSTDKTRSILESIDGIKVLHLPKNRGKGIALRKGFKYAHSLSYSHVITIDSDGQHMPEDLHKFFEGIKKNPQALIIGARNMEQESVPGASSFGHNFSNFWFKVETGIAPEDTQSGYRAYPIFLFENMRFFTSKFEFEIEVIVKAAWKGIPIDFIPVKVFYAPKEERVSHFRKVPDFTRVSILNTVLVILAIFYYRPRNFLRDIKKKNFKEFISAYILSNDESTSKILQGVFIGVFIGLSPFHGFKLMSVITLSILLKLNKFLTIGVSYIGMPPLIPFLIFFSHQLGAFVLQNHNYLVFSKSKELTMFFIAQNLIQQVVGGLVFAFIGAFLITFVSYLLIVFSKKKSA